MGDSWCWVGLVQRVDVFGNDSGVAVAGGARGGTVFAKSESKHQAFEAVLFAVRILRLHACAQKYACCLQRCQVLLACIFHPEPFQYCPSLNSVGHSLARCRHYPINRGGEGPRIPART